MDELVFDAGMVEPVGAAASAASRALVGAVTKQLMSQTGTKLGGREERRQVYARFQQATVAAMVEAQHQRLLVKVVFPAWISPRKAQGMVEPLHRLLTETLQTYMDLRVVANPKPLEAADAVLTAVNGMFDLVSGDEGEFWKAADQVGEAHRAFVDTVRDDLWYLPQWWQAYRPSWWSIRGTNRRRRKALRSARTALPT
ncbi:hypothetical protein [Streptomyces sp. Qhu_M48]|uniref:hypothetical protein n=1 Tax=Streptomyces sp. Qhu_M48 TaxID=3435889 RepID=UPI003F509D61